MLRTATPSRIATSIDDSRGRNRFISQAIPAITHAYAIPGKSRFKLFKEFTCHIYHKAKAMQQQECQIGLSCSPQVNQNCFFSQVLPQFLRRCDRVLPDKLRALLKAEKYG